MLMSTILLHYYQYIPTAFHTSASPHSLLLNYKHKQMIENDIENYKALIDCKPL